MQNDLARMLDAEDWTSILSMLTTPETLELRCREGVSLLLADFAGVLRAGAKTLPAEVSWQHASGARIDRYVLLLLETTIDAHREALERAPDRLFPVLYNTLYWVDAPENEAHGVVLSKTEQRGLWRWMESWRRVFEARSGAKWLRRMRPPRPTTTTLLGWRTLGGAPALSPDGRWLLVTHKDRLELLDAVSGRSVGRLPKPSQYLGAEKRVHGGFSPDSKQVLTFEEKSATLWNIEPLEAVRTFGPCDGAVGHALFSHDGSIVFLASYKTLSAWNCSDGTPLGLLSSASYVKTLFPCGSDGVLVADNIWRLWSPRENKVLASSDDSSNGPVWNVAVNRSGDRIVVRRRDALEGWSLPDAKQYFSVKYSAQSQLDIHPTRALAALRTNGQTCALHELETGALCASVPCEHVQSLSFDPTGRWLVCGAHPLSVLWSVEEQVIVAWAWHKTGPSDGAVSFDREAKRLAIGDKDSTLVLDLSTLSRTSSLRDDDPPPLRYWSPRTSPGGTSLMVHTAKGLAFFSFETGTLRAFVPTSRAALFVGKWVLAHRDTDIILIDPEQGCVRATLSVPGDALEVPEDKNVVGDSLFARTRGGQVVLFSLLDGTERYRVPSSSRLTVLTPELFLTHNASGALCVRAVESGAELLVLPENGGTSFLLSPDHRWLAVYGFSDTKERSSSTVAVWELVPEGRHHFVRATFDHFSVAFTAKGTMLSVSSVAPTPQSGNSDPEEACDEVSLEPGDAYLCNLGFAASAAVAVVAQRKLRDLAPEVEWDRGGGALGYSDLHELPSGAVFVAEVNRGQLELFRMQTATT